MSMIESYQQEQTLERPQPEAARLATVDYVGNSGLQLIFDGETYGDGKYYLCNNGIKYQGGDRVLVQKVGGSYIVVCRVGRPDATIWVDRADKADEAYRAIRVKNMASGKADLEFYKDAHGSFWIHNSANTDSQWDKAETTEIGRPGSIDRPTWP